MPSRTRGIKEWPKQIRQEKSGGSFIWQVRILNTQVNSLGAKYCPGLRVILTDLEYVIDGHSFRLIYGD